MRIEGTRKLESILVDKQGGDKEVRKVLEGGCVSGVTSHFATVPFCHALGVTHRTAWNVL